MSDLPADHRFNDPVFMALTETMTTDIIKIINPEIDTLGHKFGSHRLDVKNMDHGINHELMMHNKTVDELKKTYQNFLDGEEFEFEFRLQCHSCGKTVYRVTIGSDKSIILKHIIDWETKEQIQMNRCEAESPEPYLVELDVPSGKMIVANHQTPAFDLWERDEWKDKRWTQEYSINHLAGKIRTSEAYASIGYIELNIGNCACLMYRDNGSKEKFIVGSYLEHPKHYTDDPYWQSPEAQARVNEAQKRYGKPVADVCTDFWGYGVSNYTLKVKRLLESRKIEFTIVKCKPGRYRFTHRYHLNTGTEYPEIYTTIERIVD